MFVGAITVELNSVATARASKAKAPALLHAR
jgi:hypothetical protein